MSDSPTPVVQIRPERVLIILLVCTALLAGLAIWGQYIKYHPGTFDINGHWEEFGLDLLMHTFDMNAEADVPTFFNTILLFIPFLLLAAIAAWKFMIRDKFRVHWAGLSLLFLYLATDEAAVLHETLIKPMRAEFNQPGGLFYFAWVIPALLFLVLLGLAYLRFFLHLEPKFKLLFFSSIALYFLGEVGGEMVSGWFAENLGQKNYTYAVASSFEEAVALIGLALVIYSLLKYIQHYLPDGMTLKV